MITQSQFYDESLIFGDQFNPSASFLNKQVDELTEYRCECTVSESCNICETKKWMQMLLNYNPILATQQLPQFPEYNLNVPLFLSKTYQIIHDILNYRQSLVKNSSSAEDQIFKWKSDNEALKIQIRRLQESIDLKVKQIGQFENQLFLQNKSNKQAQEKTHLQQEELNQKVLKMQNKIGMMQTEMKKKDQEYSKIKEALRSKDKFNYINRLDVIPIKQTHTQQFNFDNWTHTRKSMIEDYCCQQELLCQIVQNIQQFLITIQVEPFIFDQINTQTLKIPRNQSKVLQWLNTQLNQLGQQIMHLKGEIPQEEYSNILADYQNKQQQPQQQQQQQQQIIVSEKHNRSLTYHNTQNLDNSMTQSVISRISFKDVPDIQSGSPQFKSTQKEGREKTQLKRWEFVFKE